ENGFQVDGYVPRQAGEVPIAGMRGVSAQYFSALGARLKAGRAVTEAERTSSQPVAIVNEAFARRYWPGQDPIGRRLQEYGGATPSPARGPYSAGHTPGSADEA